jgi:acetyl-CoA C-acetyltransferase
MKTVAQVGGDYLGTAAWYELEAKGVEFPFPKLFGKLGDEYDKRYGLKDEHLAHISAVNYANAKLQPEGADAHLVHERGHALRRDEDNAAVGGRIKHLRLLAGDRRRRCVFLASREVRREVREARG